MNLKNRIVRMGLVVMAALSVTACAAGKPKVSEEKLNEMMDQNFEKQAELLDQHADLWDKVYEEDQRIYLEEQETQGDQETDELETEDSAEEFRIEDLKEQYLALLERTESVLTEEEMETLKKDVDELCKLQQEQFEIYQQLAQFAPSDEVASEDGDQVFSTFPDFQTKDFDGKEVDQTIFAEHAVTVVNFWYNECSPCVEELPALQALHEELQEKGGAVLGINADHYSNEDSREILSAQHVTYQNLSFDPDSEAGKATKTIQAFPTTILFDRNGKQVGEPIVGGLVDEKEMAKVKERIDAIVEQDAQNQ